MVQEPSTDQPGLLVCGFSPDGSHIVAGCNDCHIYAWFWDIASAADKGKAAAKQGFYNVVSEQDAVRNLDPAAAVDLDAVDWPEPQEICRLGGHVNDVLLLQFSHDGQSIATGSKDGTMRVKICIPALHTSFAYQLCITSSACSCTSGSWRDLAPLCHARHLHHVQPSTLCHTTATCKPLQCRVIAFSL